MGWSELDSNNSCRWNSLNRSYILITQEEWESLAETSELMQDSKLLQHIASARREYAAGETLIMEQVFG